MTYQELKGKWPIHPESSNPNNAIYVKNDSRIFVAPTETIHSKLFTLAGLPLTRDRMVVTDAGEICSEGERLSISNYRPETVSVSIFHKEYASASSMQAEFDEERKKTAGLICQLTGRVVWVQMWAGRFEIVEF